MSSQSSDALPWDAVCLELITVAYVLGLAVSSQMPERQIKELDEIVDSTRSFFEWAMEDGRLQDPQYIAETHQALILYVLPQLCS